MTPCSGEGWQITAVEVDEALRSKWNAEWDVLEGDEPLTFCKVEGDGESLITPWEHFGEALYYSMEPIQHEQARAERQVKEDALREWARSLPHDPLEWDGANEERLSDLEQRAVALDALPPGSQLRAQEKWETIEAHQSIRQTLLIDLHRAGLFDSDQIEPRDVALKPYPTLHAYHQAALALRRYLRSEERKNEAEQLKTLIVEDVAIVASPVSVDWFRLGPWIGGICDDHEVDRWCAWGEMTQFARNWPTETSTAWFSSGAIFETFQLRAENPHRAALVSVGRPVASSNATVVETGVEPSARLETFALNLIKTTSRGRKIDALLELLFAIRLVDFPKSQRAWRGLSKSVSARDATLSLHAENKSKALARGEEGEPFDVAELLRRAARIDLHRALRHVPIEQREELAIIASGHPQHSKIIAPILCEALLALEDEMSLFAKRYILKRIQPEAKGAYKTLITLAERSGADDLQPHLRWALERIPKPPWWQFW